MKKNKAVALVLAASTSATLVLAKNAITAHADTLNPSNTNVKNVKTYTNRGEVVNVTSDLKVRQGASTDTQVLGYLKPGNVFNIASKEGQWYKIQYNNQYGYVYGEYVKELNRNNNKIDLGSNEGKVVNVETNLRFRSEPSLNSSVIGYFTSGQVVKVIGETNGWYKISYQGQVGYSDANYIQGLNGKKMVVVNEPTDTTVKDITTGQVTHVQTDLRIRERATTQSDIIGRLHESDIVKVIGKDGDWYKINLNGKIGFVCADYINIFNVNNISSNNSVNSTKVVNKSVQNSNNQITEKQSVRNVQSNVKNLEVNNVTKVNKNSNKIEDQYKVDRVASKVKTNNTVVNTPQVKIETTSVKKVVSNFNGYGKVINASSGLRIRNIASTNSSILGFLYNGNTVKITGKEGNWYKIDSNGTVGYVYDSYIQLTNGQAINNNGSSSHATTTNNNTNANTNTKPSNTITPESGFGEVVNVSSNLIMRSGASTNSTILGSLNDGETFKILGKSGDWYKISKNNQIGYVFSDYVKIVNSAEANHNTNNNSSTSNNGNSMQAENSVGQVTNISSNLRVRTAPNTSSSVMGYLLSGQKIKVTGRQGNWYRINLDGSTGYVYSSYINIVNGNPNDIHNEIEDTHNNNSGQITYSNKYGQVINIDSSLRVRSGASLNSSVVGYLLNGQGVKVLARIGDWYKIDNNGQIGYTSSNYIKLSDHMISNNTNTSHNNTSHNNAVNNNTSANTNNSGNYSASYERLYTLLKDQIGSPYLWGAEGQYVTNSSLQQLKNEFPTAAAEGRYNIPSQYINHGYRGFDCSGLVDWAFSQLGISVGRTTYQQVNAGRAVSLNDVRPGDLLFFKDAVHVGVYIGNGKWIVAPHSHSYVTVQNVPWSLVGCARRVLN